MSDQTGPTLADDEATLASYARQLVAAIEQVAEPWLTGLVADRAPELATQDHVAVELSATAAQTSAALDQLLARDIADQAVGPLEIMRRAVSVPNRLLVEAGIELPARDEFSRSNFPDDAYDLTPASFAAIHPSLHEPGLMWGAAKAHVHLRRRREPAAPPPAPQVVALSVDLMDRSKISAAFPTASFVRSVDKLLAKTAEAEADLVLVDLGRVDDPTKLSSIGARVVAFGSHVNEEQLASADAAGVVALPRSVFFRRLESGGNL